MLAISLWRERRNWREKKEKGREKGRKGGKKGGRREGERGGREGGGREDRDEGEKARKR